MTDGPGFAAEGGSGPPRLEANCTAHGTPLVMCDHCANTRVMAAWAGTLSGTELAAGLEKLTWTGHYYAHAERAAILAEAARRLRGGAVYLAEKFSQGPSELAGVFSTPDLARKACKDIADEYFGPGRTDPLPWRQAGALEHWSATYQHPCNGTYVFQVTRFTVDRAPERS